MAERPIVIVNDFGHVNGGAAQVCIADAVALAQTGRRVIFFCAVGPVAPELPAAGVAVVCLDQEEIALNADRLRAARQGLWNGRAAAALDKLLSDFAAQPIVHVHGWSKALSASVVAAALARKAPVVLTLHDFFAACPNGGFYQFPQQRICELRAMSASCIACNCDSRNYAEKIYRVARQAVQLGPGRLPRGIRHFTCFSQLSARVMRPYLPADAQMHFVPNAIEGERAPAVPVAQNRDFITIGRLSPEKGGLLFAQAAAQADIRPVYVGDGRMRDAIMDSSPGAEITGWLSRDAVFARLGRARALVFPSQCYETFGLTVGEAISRGVPVIVSDCTAAAELVQDGQTGLLFPAGSAASLADAILRLQNPAFAASLGQAAYARYWDRPLTLERHMTALAQVYHRMLADQ